MAEEMEPVLRQFRFRRPQDEGWSGWMDGQWEGNPKWPFEERHLFTLAQVQAREASAWEQGRTASAEEAGIRSKGWSHRPDSVASDTAADLIEDDIRALPNPHKMEGE